jgi:DNA-binding NtrC family response regulator
MTDPVKPMLPDDHRQAGAPPRLLVVQDDPRIVHSLSQFLQSEGYRVDTAADDSRAIQMLATAHYHLVIADVKASPANGLKFLWTIRHLYPDLVVLVIADYAAMAQAAEALKAGAFGYRIRPLIDDELLVWIRKALCQPTPPPEFDLLRRQRDLQTSLNHGPRWWNRQLTSRLRVPPELACGVTTPPTRRRREHSRKTNFLI